MRVPCLLLIPIFIVLLASPPLHAEEMSVSELVHVAAVFQDDRDEDHRVAGRVQDVLLNRDGRMVSVIVNRNPVANPKDEALVTPPARRRSAYEQLYEFDIADTTYDVRRNVLYVGGDGRRYPDARNAALLPLGQVRATELLGLPVNLADEPNAGNVQDVLVDFESGRAVGIVVDIAFFGAQRLFPPALNAYDRDEQILRFALKQSELEALPKVSDDS